MLRSMIAAAMALAFAAALAFATPAAAACRGASCEVVHHASSDPRPAGRWCMWWLRRALGIPKSAFKPYEYNLARAGRYIGIPADGPCIGCIVVWRHHIGIITGRSDRGWVVKSGNDGGAVRERVRSLRGAIAFRRWPGGIFAAND